MVELMPFQGNSGRASTKMHTGRNHFENFSQNMDAMTGEQESLRVLSKGNSMERLRKGQVKHASSKNATLEQKPSSGPKIKKKAKKVKEKAKEEAAHLTDMDLE